MAGQYLNVIPPQTSREVGVPFIMRFVAVVSCECLWWSRMFRHSSCRKLVEHPPFTKPPVLNHMQNRLHLSGVSGVSGVLQCHSPVPPASTGLDAGRSCHARGRYFGEQAIPRVPWVGWADDLGSAMSCPQDWYGKCGLALVLGGSWTSLGRSWLDRHTRPFS